jgi:predicted ATP-grasp superfamily ATP-dependent carboligase
MNFAVERMTVTIGAGSRRLDISRLPSASFAASYPGVSRTCKLPAAIVLGVDTPIGLTVVRELGCHHVPVIAVGRTPRAIGGASRFARRFVVRPADRSLAQWLPDLISESGAAAIFAISEGDLIELAGLPDVIDGCRILTPRKDQLDMVLDKRRTIDAARKCGIMVPDSWQPVAGRDIAVHARTLTYPVAVKWSDPPRVVAALAAAGIELQKVEYAETPCALLTILQRYDRFGHYPLVQSYCPGEGLGQMLMMAGGCARLCFQHRRLREYPASGGVSTLCESVAVTDHAGQMEKSGALLRDISWEGPAMVEYRYDRETGHYWLMEINGRFWGSLPLAHQCGAHFAWEHYRTAVLHETSAAPTPYRLRRARYLIPDSRRLVEQMRAPSARKADAIFDYVADFFDPQTGYYIWSTRDPGPWWRDAKNVVRRLLRLES